MDDLYIPCMVGGVFYKEISWQQSVERCRDKKETAEVK